MAGSVTSFNSYTFIYNWQINSLETRLHNPTKLNSPTFRSPIGARPATKWMLTVLNEDCKQTGPIVDSQQSLSVNLTRLVCSPEATPKVAAAVGGGLQLGQVNSVSGLQLGGLTLGQSGLNQANTEGQQLGAPTLQLRPGGGSYTPPARPPQLPLVHVPPPLAAVVPQKQKNNDDAEVIWVEASLTPSILVGSVTSPGSPASLGPTKLHSRPSNMKVTNVMHFQRFLPTAKVRGSMSVTFSCQIKVWSLDKPIHVPNELRTCIQLPSHFINFHLSKCMEEARQNDLFTDVTLVASGKEFKAHKVVLASQSQFFKTHFANRWTSSPTVLGYAAGDRVEMTDVPADVMEAILSYMYTGKVADIGKTAYQLLPVAEEYGLVDLRKMCERTLANSLTNTTVISTLIHASAHNAPDLKKACMEFIVSNTAAVKQSEGWGKLKETQMYRDLWVELLENIVEKHSTVNTAVMSDTHAPQLKFATPPRLIY